ncbi:potassium channel family protein [Citricoccus nitrophenolicus]|uniref:potassium channel family protein n=1 Tax=Citricoccus nitrophenolicus TaxID=863575 RepID=UPI0036160149
MSFVSLATLGFGDVVPIDPWIRVASPLQALTGFALLTAALTWFTQVYPPLSRRRVLALDLNALAKTDYAQALPALDPAAVARVLEALAAQLNTVRVDLTQHTESYYFQEEDPDLSLARQLPHVVELRGTASACPAAELQASARVLSVALEQLAKKLQEFVRTDGTLGGILSAYAADHARTPRT